MKGSLLAAVHKEPEGLHFQKADSILSQPGFYRRISPVLTFQVRD